MNAETKLMRPELWAWLDQKNDPVLIAVQGKGTSIVVKVPKSKEIDYLFGFDSYYGSISRRDSLHLCGLYEPQRKSLYLADSPLEDLTEGLTEVERMDLQQLAEYIAKQVNQVVEGTIENDRGRLQVKELTSPDAVTALHTYQRHTAEVDAVKRFFLKDPEPIRFCSYYQIWSMTEENCWPMSRTQIHSYEIRQKHIRKRTRRNFCCNFWKTTAWRKNIRLSCGMISIPSIKCETLRRQWKPVVAKRCR